MKPRLQYHLLKEVINKTKRSFLGRFFIISYFYNVINFIVFIYNAFVCNFLYRTLIKIIRDMKTLNKYAYDYLIKLINDKDLLSIKAYSEGLGFDVNNYSSPIHYCEVTKQLKITYRRINKYYYL